MSLIRRLFTEIDIWNIAVRQITGEEEKIYAYPQSPVFIPIDFSLRYWIADPFIFQHNNETYIFMERYDSALGRGNIAYSKYQNGKWSKIRNVIRSAHHMSYPFIFRQNNEIFMIPETSQSKQIFLYRAIDFPDRWEITDSIFCDIEALDTTIYYNDEANWLFTAAIVPDNEHKQLLLYYSIDLTNWIAHAGNPIRHDELARPAGRIFKFGNRLIRPSQYVKQEDYGSSLHFQEITILTAETYQEQTFKIIKPADFSVACGPSPNGIHTYDSNSKWEVIDYRRCRLNPFKPFWIICRKITRFFMRGNRNVR